MTPPVLPTPQLGNLATDISGAAAGFIKGLQNEKERRRQAALEQALLQVKSDAANQAHASDYQILQEPGPRGLQYFRVNKITGQREPFTPADAPTRVFTSVGQDQQGNLTQVQSPSVQLAGGGPPQATQVQYPEGQQPRDIRPTPFVVEDPNGGGPMVVALNPRTKTWGVFRPEGTPAGALAGAPEGAPGQPPTPSLQPRAQQSEVEAGRGATQMSLANETLKRIEATDLGAVNEIANNQAIRRATIKLPLVGEGLAGTVQALQQAGLSSTAAEYLAALAAFMTNRVRGIAGATMTVNEMLLAMSEFVPDMGELSKPGAFEQKVLNRERIIESMMLGAGSGRQRFKSMIPGATPGPYDDLIRP